MSNSQPNPIRQRLTVTIGQEVVDEIDQEVITLSRKPESQEEAPEDEGELDTIKE